MDEEKRNTPPGEEPRVMSKEDVHDYEGLTLSEDGREERQEEPPRSGVHVHFWSFSALPWWKKALFWAAGAAAVIVFLMVAWFFLVGGLVIAGAAAVVYLLKKYVLK